VISKNGNGSSPVDPKLSLEEWPIREAQREFLPEVREPTILMVLDPNQEPASRWVAFWPIAARFDYTPATFHEWVKWAKGDSANEQPTG